MMVRNCMQESINILYIMKQVFKMETIKLFSEQTVTPQPQICSKHWKWCLKIVCPIKERKKEKKKIKFDTHW